MFVCFVYPVRTKATPVIYLTDNPGTLFIQFSFDQLMGNDTVSTKMSVIVLDMSSFDSYFILLRHILSCCIDHVAKT